MRNLLAIIIVVVFSAMGCDDDSGANNTHNNNNINNNTNNTSNTSNTNNANNTSNTNNVTGTRSFHMGFSPWLYDATLPARSWTYEHILGKGDIVSEHMEEGVPWPEALDGLPFSATYNIEISERVEFAQDHELVLQINPMNIGRSGLAPYRGESIAEPLPAEWSTRGFADPEVQTAYLNYAVRMVEHFSPKYLLIGVEVNLLLTNAPERWADWVDLNSYVYTELKTLYPDLPIGVSVFCVPYFDQWAPEHDTEAQIAALQNDIEPNVDYIAFSIHPFMSALLADSFPETYLAELFSLTSKPIAVSESSYSAQEWSLSTGLTFYGTQEKQQHFVELLLEESEAFDASYVIWFTIRDYDALWENVLGAGDDSIAWRDTGLYDEDGTPRLALDTWIMWLERLLTP